VRLEVGGTICSEVFAQGKTTVANAASRVRVVRITIFDESRYELTSYTLTSGVENAFQLGGFTECKAVNMG
jgi:hypothetical protein